MPCRAAGDAQHPPGTRGRKGPGSPVLRLVFGKASCRGPAIPAVNIHFTGPLMGTIWQRGASRPLQSRCFPVAETLRLSARRAASSGLLRAGGPVGPGWRGTEGSLGGPAGLGEGWKNPTPGLAVLGAGCGRGVLPSSSVLGISRRGPSKRFPVLNACPRGPGRKVSGDRRGCRTNPAVSRELLG